MKDKVAREGIAKNRERIKEWGDIVNKLCIYVSKGAVKVQKEPSTKELEQRILILEQDSKLAHDRLFELVGLTPYTSAQPPCRLCKARVWHGHDAYHWNVA